MKNDLDKGYILLHRSLYDNEIWNERPFSKGQAWADMLMNATYKDRNISTRFGTVHLKRGELMTSLRFMQDRYGWKSRDKCQAFLNRLKTERMIRLRIEARTTIATVLNYDSFQLNRTLDRKQIGLQPDSNRTLTGLPNTFNECNELNIHTDNAREREDFPTLIKKLEKESPPSIHTAKAAIKAAHASFEAVEDYFIENALQSQPDRNLWLLAIKKLASQFAGAKLDMPMAPLRKYLHPDKTGGETGKTDEELMDEAFRMAREGKEA